MKRKLKFKAWHISQKRFVDLNGVDIAFKGCNNGGSIYKIYEQGVLKSYPIDEVEFIEFTGLHDCHGVEIYEGDIVKVGEAYSESGMLYNSFIGKIEYNAPYFYVNQSDNIKKTDKWSGQDYKWNEIEVIGNIYSNPELL